MNAYPTPSAADQANTRIQRIQPADAVGLAEFDRVTAEATTADGYAPFNEQALLDLRAARRAAYLVREVEGHTVGAALTGLGELDLVISPEYRRRGHGGAALATLLGEEAGELSAWSHGDHPTARALAVQWGFVAVRTLLELRLPLHDESDGPDLPGTPDHPGTPEGFVIDTFRTGVDESEWVALNALIFAAHPEQGAVTESDLRDRQREHWFAAADFLVIRDAEGRMRGYNWLKVEAHVGEIYVIGVHPDAAGVGLGRALMKVGLEHLRERGCTTAALYVEADSAGPVHLYRSLGFTDHTIDVQYRRMHPHLQN
ncbi:mycothiol synthase [Cryobacterium roopkundense]|uniref:Mycothiol acetyltransferase n=1 Tax=Cryobacterium roopkundense TaxID=1001240 RepID=A0A7W8ZT42_9MICO|nr:mycothiol synthase [Cryobacterium roopkundense]MBB5639694.1 mycothiol synthase [Cryobacterium roopkundense]